MIKVPLSLTHSPMAAFYSKLFGSFMRAWTWTRFFELLGINIVNVYFLHIITRYAE
eukprot:CAMPEP_0176363000 /NCGR_PEP_ID=MMETSP0126-20121128/18809_1 /TAXON_ID=141414 ORGANISM="Strombidinopsis acuminatum, Strain SPMC142" /NCGR_SAMPLE_ID=MMETSP0126 /ASSEMBLY_ACC=CAM_ASM_000229 /LENGTH=55 /DNA_ID=CAMNT_0017719117 /DNA_START=412 /DNA_END=579 /DNA_ORIENTATION=-